MAGPPSRTLFNSKWVGWLIIAMGLAVNRYSIAWATSVDGQIESTRNNLAILAAQALCVVVGIVVLRGKWRLFDRAWVRATTALIALAVIPVSIYAMLRNTGVIQTDRERRLNDSFAHSTMSEYVHSQTEIRWRGFADAFAQKNVPGDAMRGQFLDTVTVVDLASLNPAEPPSAVDGYGVTITRCSDLTEPRTVPARELDLFAPLFAEIDRFENTWFEMLHSDFVGEDRTLWQTTAEFRGLARMKSGIVCDPCVRVTLRLQSDSTDASFEKRTWRILEFRVDSLEMHSAKTPLFTEELAQAVDDPAAVTEARRNIAEEMVVESLTSKDWKPPHASWMFAAAMQHETVAVVDLDRDGDDDFFFMPRYGRTMMFRNRGNGTFEEIADRVGLRYEDHSAAACFADYDNDGDDDLFLGRSFARSLYLENVDGRFTDRTQEHFPAGLPYFVSAISAADYDNDGLLDVYLGTYAAQLLQPDLLRKDRKQDQLLADFLPEDQARRLFNLYTKVQQSTVRDRYGPPNQLIHNEGGGRFRPVLDTPTNVFRNTFQAAWGDYDDDGDQDLYVVNDFGPNQLLRNDGEGRFTDVTLEAGMEDIAFGMGASWGDFDRDGDLDMYTSNIHSTAGRRIISRVPFLDPRLVGMAEGNSLLRNDGGKFTRVRSAAEAGGWSWSGMFQDVNNDGWTDLMVPCGYYTSPKSVWSGNELSIKFWRYVVQTDPTLGFQKRYELNLSNFGDDSPRDSFAGPDRDHLFCNRNGEYFELRGIAGLDHPGDGQTCSMLDYDRDGWPDFVVSQANAPSLLLWRNRIGELVGPSAMIAGGPPPMIALRFVGANKQAAAAKGMSHRDAWGTRVVVHVGSGVILQEHECGEGRASENSRTMHVGLGAGAADRIEVRWPSGKKDSLGPVAAGSLVTLYENPADSEDGKSYRIESYVRAPGAGDAVGGTPPAR